MATASVESRLEVSDSIAALLVPLLHLLAPAAVEVSLILLHGAAALDQSVLRGTSERGRRRGGPAIQQRWLERFLHNLGRGRG